jgi:5-methylcytosine-specific restriction endonuclease McrA
MIVMEKISRSDAIARGLKWYFTGNPCKSGHVDIRQVSNKTCRSCSKTFGEAYRCSDSYRSKSGYIPLSEWRAIISERSVARGDKRSPEQKARRKEYARRYMAGYVRRPDVRLRSKKSKAKRKAAKRMAVPNWFGELDSLVWQEAYDLCKLREKATGIKWEVDHMIPISCNSATGMHVWNNCQVIPAIMNREKSNRLLLTSHGEWIKST